VTAVLEIEHYHAKTIRPELAFHWPNLFPSCRMCNQAKGNRDHGGSMLKPDEDDPEQFFWLNLDTGELQLRDDLTPEQRDRGAATIEILDLQRRVLREERIEKIRFVKRWLSRVQKDGLTPECQEELQYLKSQTTPFQFVIRHIFKLATSPSP